MSKMTRDGSLYAQSTKSCNWRSLLHCSLWVASCFIGSAKPSRQIGATAHWNAKSTFSCLFGWHVSFFAILASLRCLASGFTEIYTWIELMCSLWTNLRRFHVILAHGWRSFLIYSLWYTYSMVEPTKSRQREKVRRNSMRSRLSKATRRLSIS